MHKTMLAAFIVGASALTIPAFAQVNLGGAGQAGARVNAGAAPHDTMHTADQVGAHAADTTRTIGHKAGHTTHKVVDKTKSAVNENGKADAGVNANASTRADAADANGEANANVNAGAGLDTAATAGKAGEAGNGVGGDVRQAAHSAIQSTDRTAGSVGDAVSNTSASGAVKADTKTSSDTNGH
jgi:hypothetical protein